MLCVCFIVFVIGLSISCIRASANQYTIIDENNVQQYVSLISIDDEWNCITSDASNKVQSNCTDEEEQTATRVIDCFFEELLRFNYALQKPAWEEINSLSDDLQNTIEFREEYNSINEYIEEHGADLNVTSLITTSLICFDRDDEVIVKVTGVLNYRFVSMDGIRPTYLRNLSFGDNPIAFTIYVRIPFNNKSAAKVIGWSFKRYNCIQENYYPEVLR